MLNLKRDICVFLAMLLIPAQAYCQQPAPAPATMTIFGTVGDVDVESGVIKIKTSHGLMVFYILTETRLYQLTHNMSIVEIVKGDPVKIQYVTLNGKNNVIKLVDTSHSSDAGNSLASH